MSRALWSVVALTLSLSGCSCGADAAATSLAPAEGSSALDTAQDEGERYLGLTQAEAERVVARVGERAITLRDVGDELNAEAGPARARHALAEHRGEVLEIIIRRALLADEARRLGFEQRDSVRRAERTMLAQLLGASWYADPTVVSEATDEEIAQWYAAHRSTFELPRRRRARYLVAPDRASAAQALARLAADPESSSLFRELSTTLAVEAPRYDAAGETGDFTESGDDSTGVDEALRRAAFAAEVGVWIPEPIETEQGFLAAQVVTEEPAASITVEQARESIRASLRQEAVARAARRLVSDRGERVEIDQEALASVRFPN